MDLEKTKKLKKLLEENFPNRKFWILDPSTQSLAEQNEVLREIEEFREKEILKENIEKISKVFLN